MNRAVSNAVSHAAGWLAWVAVLCSLWSTTAFAACSGVSPNIVCTSNTGAITLNSTTGAAPATPQTASVYPSSNVVSGVSGTITAVQVRLNGLTHSWAYDLNMLLVSPGGQTFVFWSNVGPSNGGQVVLNNANFTLSDSAASMLPQGTPAAGTYRPANYGNSADTWPAPASITANGSNSAAPFGTGTFASRFNGLSPNGTWQLYITVTGNPDTGSLQSWDLILATAVPNVATTTAVSSSVNPVQIPLAGNSTATLTATVTASGNPVTLGSVTFFDGATLLAANVPLNVNGQAAVTFNTTGAVAPVLAEGLHNISANYSGVTGFGASAGNVSQTVDRATQVTGNTFCNTGTITLPQAVAAASVYPSKLFVTGLAGTTQSVVMELKDLTHPATDDLNMLLVSPTGQKFVPFAYISNPASATVGAKIRLDDLAVNALPGSGAVVSGTYRPSHGLNGIVASPVTFVAPAPAGPYNSAAPVGLATFASTFSGASPNGTWTLYAVNWANTATAGTREIANGWCLTVGTSSDPATTITPSVTPTPSALGQSVTIAAQVRRANDGQPINAVGTVTFKEGNAVIAGPIAVGADGTVSFTTSSLIQGAHFIDAVYSGVPGSFGGSSGQVLHHVDAATTNPSSGRFCNATPLTFANAITSGSPYPTRINASGLAGTLAKVTLELNGLSHQFPDDMDMMLTGPNGNSLIAFSDAGGGAAVSGITLVLDSSAASVLPDSTSLSSGTFRPADYEVGTDTFPSPAPSTNRFSASTTTLATAFSNSNPNGLWTLWTRNDGAGAQGGGTLAGGWCVNLTMNAPALTVSKTHTVNFVQGQVGAQYAVTVGSNGPGNTAGTISVVDNPPVGMTITGMSGAGWTCTVATRTCTTTSTLAANATLPAITVTVNVAVNATSPQVNSVTVSGGGATGATANDSTVIAPRPPALVSVVSRKLHNGVTYDLPIDIAQPVTGAVTVEPRVGIGSHTLFFQFDLPVSSSAITANVTDNNSLPAGSAVASKLSGGVLVSLTGVLDRKRIQVNLSGLDNGGTATAALGFLVGDVNSSRNVDNSDVAGVKARSGQAVSATNFLYDLNQSGRIGVVDVVVTKARTGLGGI